MRTASARHPLFTPLTLVPFFTIPSDPPFPPPLRFYQVFMQGQVDHEGAINARFNYGWTPSDTTKIQASVSLCDENEVGVIYSNPTAN